LRSHFPSIMQPKNSLSWLITLFSLSFQNLQLQPTLPIIMASMNMEMSLISSSNPSNSTPSLPMQSNRSSAVCHISRSEGEMTLHYYATDAGGPAWYVKNFKLLYIHASSGTDFFSAE
jgi:hypothetical protein